jgi:two-component system chemotaxis response regulator CheB
LKKIKVLVVDDSALMRKIVADMINSEADMEAVDIARNGQDLLDKIDRLKPDVVTLDVEMPVMDGITALRELRKKNQTYQVIMLSSVSKTGTALTMECLEAGAFDFVSKPSGAISLDINKVKDELVQKIRLAYEKNNLKAINTDLTASPAGLEKTKPVRKITSERIEAVVIGASTGGPKALYSVVTELSKNIGVPVFIVQHMPVGFTKAFAERLNTNSQIKVVEASDGQSIEKDVVYIAPGGFHMEVGSDKRIHLNSEPAIWGVRPAVDKLFVSASKVYGAHILSVVLTGMGKDGAQGTVEIKKNKGITISEDKSTCTIYGMPKAAYETGMVDLVLPLNEIAPQIMKLLGR